MTTPTTTATTVAARLVQREAQMDAPAEATASSNGRNPSSSAVRSKTNSGTTTSTVADTTKAAPGIQRRAVRCSPCADDPWGTGGGAGSALRVSVTEDGVEVLQQLLLAAIQLSPVGRHDVAFVGPFDIVADRLPASAGDG